MAVVGKGGALGADTGTSTVAAGGPAGAYSVAANYAKRASCCAVGPCGLAAGGIPVVGGNPAA